MKKKMLLAVVSPALAFGLAIAASQAESSADLVEQYTQLFNELDVDHSESLNRDEVLTAGLSVESFQRLDANEDQAVSLSEFLVLAEDPEGSPSPAWMPDPTPDNAAR